MATSPPPYSTSSPIMPGVHNPLSKKRPSFTPPGPSNPKRRKPSTGPSHLRQTSFPPESSTDARRGPPTRSPSVDNVSLLSGSARGARKRPPADARSTTAGSIRGGKAGSATGPPTVGGGATGSVKAGQGGEEEEGEDDDEGGAEDAVLEGVGKLDEAAAKQEREHLRMLVDALDPDQAERYDIWRRVRLKKETVRRITNQTLSQSVPASVVTTVNGYTKLFIADIIDRARDIQAEWMACARTLPTGEVISPESSYDERMMERDKGPLLPDHIREALRRYKRDRDGGSAGFHGLSLQGKDITASRMAGRRLFR